MSIFFNNSFLHSEETAEKAVIQSTTSPQLENLNVYLCNFTEKLFNSEATQNRLITINIYTRAVKFSFICLHGLILKF